MTLPTFSDLSTVMLMALAGLALTALYQGALGRLVRAHFVQQPLQSFSTREQQLAFYGAPELRARYEQRGTMSRFQYRRALKVSLRRIRQEQARRKAEQR